jgi:hypothetical protein
MLMRLPYCPAAPLALLAAIFAGWSAGDLSLPEHIPVALGLPQLVIPTWSMAQCRGGSGAATRADGDQCCHHDLLP